MANTPGGLQQIPIDPCNNQAPALGCDVRKSPYIIRVCGPCGPTTPTAGLQTNVAQRQTT